MRNTVLVFTLLALLLTGCVDAEPRQTTEDAGVEQTSQAPDDTPARCTSDLGTATPRWDVPGPIQIFNALPEPVMLDGGGRERRVPSHAFVTLQLEPADYEVTARSVIRSGTFRFDVLDEAGQTIWLAPGDEGCIAAGRKVKAVPVDRGYPELGTFIVNLADRGFQVSDAKFPDRTVELAVAESTEYLSHGALGSWMMELLATTTDDSVPPHRFVHRYHGPTVSFLIGDSETGYRLVHDDQTATPPERWTLVTQLAQRTRSEFDICVDGTCETVRPSWADWWPALPIGGDPLSVLDDSGSALVDLTMTPLDPVLSTRFVFIFHYGDGEAFAVTDTPPLAGPHRIDDPGPDLPDQTWIMNTSDTPVSIEAEKRTDSGDPPMRTEPRMLQPGEQAWLPVAARYVMTAARLDRIEEVELPAPMPADLLVFRTPNEEAKLELGYYRAEAGPLWAGDGQLGDPCDDRNRCAVGLGCHGTCRTICSDDAECPAEEVCGRASYTSLGGTGRLCHVDATLAARLFADPEGAQQIRGEWELAPAPTSLEVALLDRGKEGRWLKIADVLDIRIDHVTGPGEYQVAGSGGRAYSPIGIGGPLHIDARGTLVVEDLSRQAIEGELQMYTTYFVAW